MRQTATAREHQPDLDESGAMSFVAHGLHRYRRGIRSARSVARCRSCVTTVRTNMRPELGGHAH